MKFPSSSTILGLPRSHYHCHLGNFNWDDPPRPNARVAVATFVEGVSRGESPRLYLYGPQGTGKTHVGVGIYRAGVHYWGTHKCLFLQVADFCREVKQGYGKGFSDPYERVREATKLIVLDDLFAQDLTAHELGTIIPAVIQISHENRAALVSTTNYTQQETADRLHPHEVSRLLDGANAIHFKGEDKRTSR